VVGDRNPFPARGHDGEEPEDSCLLPSDENGSGGLPEGAEQGLYVTLPAEELTLAGFAQGGRADTMTPGPLMAVVVQAVVGENGAGLTGLSDDQLVGVISAARRLEAGPPGPSWPRPPSSPPATPPPAPSPAPE
jgi:hypothetical protein